MATQPSKPTPAVIAHRGNAREHPENSLAALTSAVAVGARYVEFDIQLTADLIPLLLHDETLLRTHRDPDRITDLTLNQLKARGWLHHTAHTSEAITRLETVSKWLQTHPDVTAFVEIKRESLRRFGRRRVLKVVHDAIKTIEPQCVIISYDARLLLSARQLALRVGYVLPGWQKRSRRIAERLQPDFLFVNRQHLPRDGQLWPGNWFWAVFEIPDLQAAHALAETDVHFIETMAPAVLLEKDTLHPSDG